MVEKYESVRNKLDVKVFGKFGKSVTFISKSSPVYNVWGDEESVTNTETSLIIVPYNLMSKRQSYEKFGQMNEGDFDAAVRYDTTIAVDNELVFNGVNYKVKEIGEEYLKELVVIIIRLTKG